LKRCQGCNSKVLNAKRHAGNSIDFRGSAFEFQSAGFNDWGLRRISDLGFGNWDLLKGLNSYLKGNKPALGWKA
jgi:hypothetical protein